MDKVLTTIKHINYGRNRIFIEVKKMELAEIRNELEKTAKRLADFRGSL
ncbi:hypothetical protein QFZ28_001232 [Neobacillus niacini]|jgi:hypothetical protein|nr:hypothetical protein [Neobacillus niacini]